MPIPVSRTRPRSNTVGASPVAPSPPPPSRAEMHHDLAALGELEARCFRRFIRIWRRRPGSRSRPGHLFVDPPVSTRPFRSASGESRVDDAPYDVAASSSICSGSTRPASTREKSSTSFRKCSSRVFVMPAPAAETRGARNRRWYGAESVIRKMPFKGFRISGSWSRGIALTRAAARQRPGSPQLVNPDDLLTQ